MSLCDKCTGICCKSINVPLATPATQQDWDYFRWYLSRPGTKVWRQNNIWWLSVDSVCDHMDPKTYRCGIYEKRPRVCREYPAGDNCEYNWSMDWYDVCEQTGERLHFSSDQELEDWYEAYHHDVLPQRDRTPISVRGKVLNGR
jgi:Fe-S-cluster containining protein